VGLDGNGDKQSIEKQQQIIENVERKKVSPFFSGRISPLAGREENFRSQTRQAY